MKIFSKKTNGTISSLAGPRIQRFSKRLKIAGKFLIFIFVIFAILGLGVYIGQRNPQYSLSALISKINIKREKPKNVEIQFFSEIYNLIKKSYWDNTLDDTALSNIYFLALQKLSPGTGALISQDEAGVEKLLVEAIKPMDQEQKIAFITQLSDVVLQNLRPFGRSRLYGEKMITDITNEVKNVSPGTNLYADLGVSRSSPQQEIEQAYETKIYELESQQQTPEVQQKIQNVQKAYSTVGDTRSRENYDVSGVESTITYKLINPRIFYMHFTRFSPTSLDDIKRAADKVDSSNGSDLDTLIFDLRDNIGGLVDGLPYFLGPFIGPDQYAYQLFSRGDKADFKTKFGWLPSLVRYKKVIFLINGGCQSSTEVFAATVKNYNVGVLVGTKTKGWGTVEKIEPLNIQPNSKEKYSVLLVEHLTLREDGQAIEGMGVDPNIDITTPDWEDELFRRFNSQEIVDVVKEILKPDIDGY